VHYGVASNDRRHWSGSVMDIIIASLSLVISIIAAVFVWHQSMIMRHHNKMSMRPHIIIGFLTLSEDDEYVIKFNLMNAGVGPAFVVDYCVCFDGVILCTSSTGWDGFENIDEKFREFVPNSRWTRLLFDSDWSFPANQNHDILTLRLKQEAVSDSAKYREFMLKFGFIIKYKSIYDEMFTARGYNHKIASSQALVSASSEGSQDALRPSTPLRAV
jgi:hypothetical protein